MWALYPVEPKTVMMLQGGQGDEEEDWEKCSYRIFLHSEDGEEDEVEDKLE